jgi:flagellar hook-length control protein FliK
MNLTLTNLNQPAVQARPAAPSAANDASAPLQPELPGAASPPGPASADASANSGTQPAPAPAPSQPALAFAQWLGLEQIAPVAVEGAPPAPANTAQAETPAEAEEQRNADAPLLGAMSMPLMPLMPTAQATLAAVAAALPGVPAAKEFAQAADTEVPPSPGTAASHREGRAAPAGLPATAPVLAPADTPAQAAPAAASPAAPAAAQPAAPAAAQPAALASETAASTGDAAQDQAAPATERGAAHAAAVQAPAAGTAQRTADTVTLSGPPTAWRQTLQEALGERLQLQVGKNAEQAVIRLEPPMLGRVEIAIRHSAGSLEVHISATHGEVLRQLQSVSEGLRSDLAQRQFSDVAVNVAPAARGANGTPMFTGGDGRGRERDGREQEQDPGKALAEANTGPSPFSLNGRGQGRS